MSALGKHYVNVRGGLLIFSHSLSILAYQVNYLSTTIGPFLTYALNQALKTKLIKEMRIKHLKSH